MMLYALKIAMLAIAAATIAWAAVMLCWFAVDMYRAKNYDFPVDGLDANELAESLDELEEAISMLRFHCNQMEVVIVASPLIGLLVIPLYKLLAYIMSACERQAGCARRELMRQMAAQGDQPCQ